MRYYCTCAKYMRGKTMDAVYCDEHFKMLFTWSINKFALAC